MSDQAREPDATITITLHYSAAGTTAATNVQASATLGEPAHLALSHAANVAAREMGRIVNAATLDNAGQLDRLRRAPIVGTVPLPPTERRPGIGVA